MKRIYFVAIMLLLGNIVQAQQQDISEKPEMYKGKQVQTEDTTSLLSAFKRGRFNGYFRYFFMSTQNEKGLTDYYANAAGAGLRYETATFHGFKFAVSGFYTFNIGSSDLGKRDSLTGQPNRYEIGLFDVENPYNKKNIDRLEEFYVKYQYKKSNIIFGRQLINTPFINLQDGRMRPTGVEGMWLDVKEFKIANIELGWLYAISPRGTTKWFNIGESVGLYPGGVHVDGTKSNYANNIDSKAVFTLATHIDVNKFFQLHVWDLYAHNIFNSAMLQMDLQFPLKKSNSIFASAQFIRQDAVRNGGNENVEKAYFEKNGKAVTFGVKAGWKNKQLEASVNYTRITAAGRYLMPREWGRDPFFTFMPRERNEGFGDVQAFMGKLNYNIPKQRFKTSLAYGYYKMPDVKNFRLNKYGLPSYSQINADVKYSFSKLLNVLEAQLLVVHKTNMGDTYQNKNFEFNKVNMTLYNIVFNYHF